MSKRPVAQLFADKFNECKNKINEEMRKNTVINRTKRQILNASGKRKYILKHQVIALYYEAIYQLCFSIRDDEADFCNALKKVMNKVEGQSDKKEMICALAQFCRDFPNELSSDILYEYAARWHSKEINLFSLIYQLNYKPFWNWMIRNKINDFDLEYLFSDCGLSFENIVSWIASDKEYTKEFFETNFDFFMEQILQYIKYSEGYDMDDPLIVVGVGDGAYRTLSQSEINEIQGKLLTLARVFDTICRILPKYEIKMLNYIYLRYMAEEEHREYLSIDNFMYILNRMADYEYATGKDVFCHTELVTYPGVTDVAPDGSIDVVADAHDIIYTHSLKKEVAEIAWILQNRFGVDESVINDAIVESATEEFESGNLNDLVYNEKLEPLFQFSAAYNIFLLYLDDIVKNTAKHAFAMLEEEYGIECKMVKI